MTTDLIILRSVFGKVGMKYYINPTRDPRTGMYPPCVKQVDSKGDMILTDAEKNDGKVYIPVTRSFVIEDGTVFDLSIPQKKAEWEAIQFCPVIALSRDQRDSNGNLVIDGSTKRYGTAELYIERPGYATNKRVSKRKLVHKAEEFILNDPKGDQGRNFMARLLGKNLKGMPSADVEDYLLNIAQQDPEKIINLYSADDISYRLLFADAKDKHVIILKNKVYMYGAGQIVIAATDDAAVEWLINPKNAKVVELIRRDTYPEMYASKEETVQSELKAEEPEVKFASSPKTRKS